MKLATFLLSAMAVHVAADKLYVQQQSINETRVSQLCDKVIKAIPHCDAFVTKPDFYIKSMCVGDAKSMNDMSPIYNAKLAYLRQCRRQMDSAIVEAENTGDNAKVAEIKKKRAELTFGEGDKCPHSCSNRGTCRVDACECSKDFSGLTCDLDLKE